MNPEALTFKNRIAVPYPDASQLDVYVNRENERPRLRAEGKKWAAGVWDVIGDEIPDAEISSQVYKAKVKEVVRQMKDDGVNAEMVGLLSRSLEARVNNLHRQEKVTELKASNSPWKTVVEESAAAWRQGVGATRMTERYVVDQLAEAKSVIDEAMKEKNINPNGLQGMLLEDKIANATLAFVRDEDEKTVKLKSHLGRDLAEVTRVAVGREMNADIGWRWSESQNDWVKSADQSMAFSLKSVVEMKTDESVRKIEEVKIEDVQKAARLDVKTRLAMAGTAAIAAIGSWLGLGVQSIGPESVQHALASDKVATMPVVTPTAESVNENYWIKQGGEENKSSAVSKASPEVNKSVEKVVSEPEFGIKGVAGFDLTKPFTITIPIDTAKIMGLDKELVIPAEQYAQYGEMPDPKIKDLETGAENIRKHPNLIEVVRTHVPGLTFLKGHSGGYTDGWVNPIMKDYSETTNGRVDKRRGYLPLQGFALADANSLLGSEIEISQDVDGKYQTAVLRFIAIADNPSGYKELAEGKDVPDGTFVKSYKVGQSGGVPRTNVSLEELNFSPEQTDEAALAIDACFGEWISDIGEYEQNRAGLLKFVALK